MIDRIEQIRERLAKRPNLMRGAWLSELQDWEDDLMKHALVDVPYLFALYEQVKAQGEEDRAAMHRFQSARDQVSKSYSDLRAVAEATRRDALREAVEIADTVEQECHQHDWLGRHRAVQIGRRLRELTAVDAFATSAHTTSGEDIG